MHPGAFVHKVGPLRGSLRTQPAFPIFDNDASRERGHCGQRSRRIITILGLGDLTTATPEVLTFNLAMPGSVPTMNSHTMESRQLTRLEKAAALIPWPEAHLPQPLRRGYLIFTDKWIFEQKVYAVQCHTRVLL